MVWPLQKVHSGARWLLTIANLDPYPLLLQRQFLALAQLRAIETGRDLLASPTQAPPPPSKLMVSELLVAPGRVGLSAQCFSCVGRNHLFPFWRCA